MPEAEAEGMDQGAPPGSRRNRSNPLEALLRQMQEQQEPEVGFLVHPGEHDGLNNMVLYDECIQSILLHLKALSRHDELERVWALSRIQPMLGRCILNFVGVPGTGKTRAALGVAKAVGKPMYQVDYSQIISKYFGDTAKHIVYAFERAKHHRAILFFDEADSLMSQRLAMDRDCATSINQNRNTLFQQLDRFDGVVILTSNMFANYDEALLRRIAAHIEFKLPDHKMRVALFKMHLPNPARVKADLEQAAKEAEGFSGGDILTVCLNAMYAASWDDNPDRWIVTMGILEEEIQKVQATKTAWAGGLTTNKKKIPIVTGGN